MSYESNDKMVSHPSHYKFGNFEVIDVVDAVTEELSGYECNYTAQALQYLMRWHRKNGDQDLEKAIWFIQRILDKHKEKSEKGHAAYDEWLAEKRLKDELDYPHSSEEKIFTPGAKRASIDDEPEKLELRKNAAGVYVPEDREEPFMNPPYEELLDLYKVKCRSLDLLADKYWKVVDERDRFEEENAHLEEEVKGWKAKAERKEA